MDAPAKLVNELADTVRDSTLWSGSYECRDEESCSRSSAVGKHRRALAPAPPAPGLNWIQYHFWVVFLMPKPAYRSERRPLSQASQVSNFKTRNHRQSANSIAHCIHCVSREEIIHSIDPDKRLSAKGSKIKILTNQHVTMVGSGSQNIRYP